ncbi:MAG: hypothetical protein HXS46_16710 [Theionarchaea archaeon]|nr:hypothetical protein [Theionarchaea archaeon]
MKSFIELDDLEPKYMDLPQHWNDWYFTASFEYGGKDHFLVMAITEGTFMGGSGIGIGLSSDPFSPTQEGDAQVVGEAVNHISVQKLHPAEKFKCRKEGDTITVEMDDLTALCRKDEQKIISRNESIKGELTCTPRGPVLRWGDRKDGQCPVTEGTSVGGIESLSDVHGTMTIKGEKVEITGRGVFEHVWIKALEFMKIRTMDWVYINSDQMYMFSCHCESISDDGTPYHFEDGTIYLIEQDDYLVTKKIDFMPETWAYLKPFRRFIPSNQKVAVQTEKGTLEMKIALSLYPHIAQAVRMEPLTMHSITGWNVMFFDAPIRVGGKFSYVDGKTVELSNGTGVNEQLRILPL